MGHFTEQKDKPTKITMSVQNTARDTGRDETPPVRKNGIEGMCLGCMPSSIDFHNKIGQDTDLQIYHSSTRTGPTPKE